MTAKSFNFIVLWCVCVWLRFIRLANALYYASKNDISSFHLHSLWIWIRIRICVFTHFHSVQKHQHVQKICMKCTLGSMDWNFPCKFIFRLNTFTTLMIAYYNTLPMRVPSRERNCNFRQEYNFCRRFFCRFVSTAFWSIQNKIMKYRQPEHTYSVYGKRRAYYVASECVFISSFGNARWWWKWKLFLFWRICNQKRKFKNKIHLKFVATTIELR